MLLPKLIPTLALNVSSNSAGPFTVVVSVSASPSVVFPCTTKLPELPTVTVVPLSSISPVPKVFVAVHLASLLAVPEPNTSFD